MENIILISIIILCVLSCGAVLTISLLSERNRHGNKSIVEYSPWLMSCGIITQIMVTVCTVLMFVNEGYFLETIISGIVMEVAATVTCIVGVLMSCVWRIEYDKEGFTHQNVFGAKHCYRYDDIVCVVVRGVKYKIILRNDNKSVSFISRTLGSDAFIYELHSKNITFTTKLVTR